MSSIELGTTKNQILATLGNPIQETFRSGMEVLWYESKTPSRATFYYLKEGKLLARSVSVVREHKAVHEYTTKYGAPIYSIRRYGKDIIEDTPPSTVHVWPERGFSIIAYGQELSSPVEREEYFSETTKENFLEGWGKDLIGHEVATATASIQQTPKVTNKTPPQYTGVFLWSIVGIALLLVTIFMVRRLRHRKQI